MSKMIDPILGGDGAEQDPCASSGAPLRAQGTMRDAVALGRGAMRRAALVATAMLAAAGAHAHRLAVKDLRTVERAVTEALGPGFVGRAAPTRIDLICSSCAGEPIVGIRIGTQDDGTEQRVRAGRTTMADLERICRARSPECRITALDVAPAVGWVSSYPVGDGAGATAVVIRDGDLLTIRSIATDATSARANIDKLMPLVNNRIVGR